MTLEAIGGLVIALRERGYDVRAWGAGGLTVAARGSERIDMTIIEGLSTMALFTTRNQDGKTIHTTSIPIDPVAPDANRVALTLGGDQPLAVPGARAAPEGTPPMTPDAELLQQIHNGAFALLLVAMIVLVGFDLVDMRRVRRACQRWLVGPSAVDPDTWWPRRGDWIAGVALVVLVAIILVVFA